MSAREEKKDYLSEGKDAYADEDNLVAENVLPALLEFMMAARFRSTVRDFAQTHRELFLGLGRAEGKEGDRGVLELTHEHKQAFDEYQGLLERLFEDFASEQRTSLKRIFQCCQDTVEGKYAPLFGEDEHAYIVEQLMDFMDFDHFVSTMRRNVAADSRK